MSILGDPVIFSSEGDSTPVWVVNFYDYFGEHLIKREYVASGRNCLYGANSSWSLIQGGTAIPDITKNVETNLDLYSVARTLLYDTNPNNILIEAFSEDYTDGDMTWNGLTIVSENIGKSQDGALDFSSGYGCYYDLESQNQECVIYALQKVNTVTNYRPAAGNLLCGRDYDQSVGNAPCWCVW